MTATTMVSITEQTRFSYRQLDYWAKHGMFGVQRANPGAGNRRHRFNEHETQALLYLDELYTVLERLDLTPQLPFLEWVYNRLCEGIEGHDPLVVLMEAVAQVVRTGATLNPESPYRSPDA